MPWIQNVSLADIQRGFHYDAGPNSMLIQIVDPDMEFPVPKHEFTKTHQFKFLDVEDDIFGKDVMVTDDQAAAIVAVLKDAFSQRMNVIVHCVAGICRSGAVTEVGVIMGFDDTEGFRNPNLLVKSKMLKALGWYSNFS